MLDWLKKLFGGGTKGEQPAAGMEEAQAEQPAPEAPEQPVAPEEEVQN